MGTPLFWPAMADAALTPDLALAYLGELSTDIRAVAILDEAGALQACSRDGDSAKRMGELVGELFESAGEPVTQVEVAAGEGCVFAVREAGWTIAAVTGRFALPSLTFFDLRSVALDLSGGTA
ncbi:MAG TPA: hypothetical protein VNT32_07905 [Thermoleophilaceae bacterium]|nr:hypothetical protein [Thermoleophilaceae bacterium]